MAATPGLSSLNLSSTPAVSPATQTFVVFMSSTSEQPAPLERGELIFVTNFTITNQSRPRIGQLQPTAEITCRGKQIGKQSPGALNGAVCATIAEAVTWHRAASGFVASVAVVIEGTDILSLPANQATPWGGGRSHAPGAPVFVVRATGEVRVGELTVDDITERTLLGYTSTACNPADSVIQVYFSHGLRTAVPGWRSVGFGEEEGEEGEF